MKFTVALAVVIGVGLLACSSAVPAPVEPTPNIEATVEARLSQDRAVDATIEARLKEEKASIPTYTPMPTYTPDPTPSPTATAQPTPTPSPTATAQPTPTPSPTATALPDPTSHPWGSRVTYFENAVYFLSPVTQSKASEYLEFLKHGQIITFETDKRYQLRQVDGVFEIRNGIYRRSEFRYLTSLELDGYLLNFEQNLDLQVSFNENICTRQEEVFNGITTIYKWVDNPYNGFDDVVVVGTCTTVNIFPR